MWFKLSVDAQSLCKAVLLYMSHIKAQLDHTGGQQTIPEAKINTHRSTQLVATERYGSSFCNRCTLLSLGLFKLDKVFGLPITRPLSYYSLQLRCKTNILLPAALLQPLFNLMA